MAVTGIRTRCTRCCTRERAQTWVSENKLLLVTFVAVTLGVILGLSLRFVDLSDDAVAWIRIWGELFLRMLKCIILPLVTSCLVVGVSSLDGSAGGFLGAASLVYIFSTQLIAVFIGIVLAVVIHPGDLIGEPSTASGGSTSYTDVFTDFLRNIFPENIIQACTENAYTNTSHLQVPAPYINASTGNVTFNATELVLVRKLMYRSGINTIGVVTFTLAVGFGISAAGSAGRPLLQVFESLNVVIFKVMTVIIWYSPVGILSLIAGAIVEVEDLSATLSSLALFVGTVITGLLLHTLIVLPLLYFLFVRKNPFTYLFHILDSLLAASAPPSSAAGLPYLLLDCTEKLQIDSRVAKFFLPVCITINKDGSSMFICMAAIFIAQTYGIVLGIGQYFILGLMVTLLSAALAAIPSASIFVLLMVSAILQVPMTERLGLLMAVEWITDRVRTMCNMASHGYGCAIVATVCQSRLESPDRDVGRDTVRNDTAVEGAISDESLSLMRKGDPETSVSIST